MIGKAIALYALWQAWRGRKTWQPRSYWPDLWRTAVEGAVEVDTVNNAWMVGRNMTNMRTGQTFLVRAAAGHTLIVELSRVWLWGANAEQTFG